MTINSEPIDNQIAPTLAPSQHEQPVVDQIAQRAGATLDVLESLSQELEEQGGLPLSELDFRLPSDFLLSIVVPVFNEEATICRVVGGLMALPIPIEVIIVDDGSTDGTCAILTQLNRQYPQLQIIFQETNQGKGAALRRVSR